MKLFYRHGSDYGSPIWPAVFPAAFAVLMTCLALVCPARSRAQSWVSVGNNGQFFSSLPILLTDGTVIVQDTNSPDWWKLTPDNTGSYQNGTWTQIASMPVINGTQYSPLYYGSAVLADGKVVVFGGEYNGGNNAVDTNLGAVYDPVANTWTALAGPGWANIGDAPTCVLPNGKFMLGDPFSTRGALLDPVSLTWTNASMSGKADINAEEGWTLLADGTFLTVDTEDGRNSEIYNPATGAWASAGSTLVTLPAGQSGFVPEMGPQVLRPDGTVICFGASGHNSLYNSLTKLWTAMPDFPNKDDCGDAPACLLPDGNVLVCTSPGLYNDGLAFYEFDGANINPAPNILNFATELPSFACNMLMLPTGQVLLSDDATEVELYTPAGSPNAAWAPTISSCPTACVPGQTYAISGTQFNGLSQSSAYGDDAQNATNYPLVRVKYTATGHVKYFRTHDHSTMAVATGSATVSTNFDVPASAELGQASLVVVTNGIPSAPVAITVTKTPTANPQTDSVAHNTATPLTLTGSDPDNPPLSLTFAIATQPSNGTLTGLNTSTGAVIYTPNSGFQGTDSFTFTVNNGFISSSPALVTLNVAPGVPTALPQSDSVTLGTPTPITLTGTDPDVPALPLTCALATQPANGTLTGFNNSTGAVTYTPNSGFQGADSFTFTVSNGTFTSAAATVTLNVAAGTPTANPQSVSVSHNTAKPITLTGSDPDTPPLTLTFAIATQPTSGALSGFNAATGAVTYTPAAKYQGTDSFTFTVSNGANTSAAATVTLNIAPGTPTANPQTVAVAHNTATPITLTGVDPDVPVLPLSFAIAAQPANGTLSGLNSSTGAVTYTPNNNFQGTDTFTFTVSNAVNTSAAATVILKVAAGIPVANPQTVAVAHNTTKAIALTGTDPDNPALKLTFAIASQPSHGTLGTLNAATGAVTYTPATGFQGTDSFTFTVSNGINISAAATVTLNVAAGTPTANAQTVAVAHNTAASITLTGTDPDVPALPLTFAIAAQPAHGTLSGLNTTTGAVTYTPASNFQGKDTFTFTVNNGTVTSAPATVTLNVAPGTPTANPQTVAVAHNTVKTITLTGTDPDNPALKLTFALGSGPSHGVLGTINAATGVVSYEPTTNYHGADSFTFTVSNGVNTSAPATVTLNIAAGTPVAVAQTVAVAHNTAKAITLTGVDPEVPALPLTFAIAASPAHGSLSGLNSATGAVTYTPNSNFQGTDTFTFTVSNGANTSAPATVTLKVAAGIPTANPQTVSVAHNTAAAITLTGSDTDSPALPLTFALKSNPTHGTLTGFNAATGAVTYTPANNFQGTDTFTFTVSNSINTSAAATVTLKVAGGTPVANPQTVAVAHNTTKAIALTGTDPDTPPAKLTFAIASQPAHGTLGTLNSVTGGVTYTPSTNFQGTDSFTFTVNNGSSTSAAAAVTLNVAAGTPIANPQTIAVAHNTAASITLTGTDPDVPALPLTFAIAAQPAHGTLSGLNTTTGAVTYTPASNFQGKDTFTFTVNNGTVTSAPATVTLNVAPGTPTANPQTVAVAHNTVKTITLTGTDPDNPALKLTFALGSGPSHGVLGTINAATGVVSYEPTTNYHGADSFTFTVSNGVNTSAPATVTLNIAPGTPVAIAQTVTVAHNTAKAITLTGVDSDVPALSLTFAIAASPANGSLSGFNSATGAVTYTPNSNFQGTDTFTFTVNNGTVTSAPATVTLKVAPGTPTANSQTVNVTENVAISITLTGTDPDNPALPLTFAIGAAPKHGTLGTLNTATGVVTYTPAANYTGADSFTFTVSNGVNKSAPATVTLNITSGGG